MQISQSVSTTYVKKSKFKGFLKEYTVPYLMLAPNFILFCVFVLYPLCWSLRFMFYDYDGISTAIFTGLDNFVRVFTRDPDWWRAVGNTLIFTGGKLLIEIPLAIVLAVILNGKIRGKSFLRAAFFLPNVTSAAVMGMVFMFMFSPYNGYINGLLLHFGIITKSVNWLASPVLAMVSCILVSVWQNFGQNMLLSLSGLQNIPTELYESANIDGANKFQAFFKITLPMLAPMLQVILMLAIIGSLHTFDGVYVLTAGGPNHATEIMGISIFKQFFAADQAPDYGYGATLGFLSSMVTGVITVIYMISTKKMKTICD